MEGFIQALYYFGAIIYEGVGDDKKTNLYKGDAPFLGIEFGFGTSVQPMNTISRVQSYDGNNFTIKSSNRDHENWTVDLQGAVEFWPLFGDYHGFGAFIAAKVGMNLLLEGSFLEAAYGFRAQTGFKWIKLFGEYSRGAREMNHFPWIDPVELGSGSADYLYQRFRFGPRFSFPANFFGPTILHLDFHPVFELPDLNHLFPGVLPQPGMWSTGIHMSAWGHNRIRIFLEVIWNQYRTGNVNFDAGSKKSTDGMMLTLGVMRRVDLFASSAYQGSLVKLKAFQNSPFKAFLTGFNPGFTWSDAPNNQYGNQKLNLSMNWVWGEVDYQVLPFLALSGGLALNAPSGAFIRTIEPTNVGGIMLDSESNYELECISIDLPIGARFSLPTLGLNRYWMSLAFVNRFPVFSELRGSAQSPLLELGQMENYVPAWRLGIGTDVAINSQTGIRLGVHYQDEIRPLLRGMPQQGLFFQVGLLIAGE